MRISKVKMLLVIVSVIFCAMTIKPMVKIKALKDNKVIEVPLKVARISKFIKDQIKLTKKKEAAIDIDSATLKDMIGFMKIVAKAKDPAKEKAALKKAMKLKIFFKKGIPKKFQNWIDAQGMMNIPLVSEVLARYFPENKLKKYYDKLKLPLPAHIFEVNYPTCPSALTMKIVNKIKSKSNKKLRERFYRDAFGQEPYKFGDVSNQIFRKLKLKDEKTFRKAFACASKILSKEIVEKVLKTPVKFRVLGLRRKTWEDIKEEFEGKFSDKESYYSKSFLDILFKRFLMHYLTRSSSPDEHGNYNVNFSYPSRRDESTYPYMTAFFKTLANRNEFWKKSKIQWKKVEEKGIGQKMLLEIILLARRQVRPVAQLSSFLNWLSCRFKINQIKKLYYYKFKVTKVPPVFLRNVDYLNNIKELIINKEQEKNSKEIVSALRKQGVKVTVR